MHQAASCGEANITIIDNASLITLFNKCQIIQESERQVDGDGFESVQLEGYEEHTYENPEDMYLTPNSFYYQPTQ